LIFQFQFLGITNIVTKNNKTGQTDKSKQTGGKANEHAICMSMIGHATIF